MEIDALFERSIGPLAASLRGAVQAALNEYEKLVGSGQKGELAHIYISFLLSSVLCRLPWLRIDLYDENDRLDTCGCSVGWDVPQISEQLYRDADVAGIQQDEKPKDYQIEQAWLSASGEYIEAFERFLPTVICESGMSRDLGCRWHFGQLLGNTKTVFGGNEDAVL